MKLTTLGRGPGRGDLLALLGSDDPVGALWCAQVARRLAARSAGQPPRLILARPAAKPSDEQWQTAAGVLAGTGVTLASRRLTPGGPRLRDLSADAVALVPSDGPESHILASIAADWALPVGLRAADSRNGRATPWSLPPSPGDAVEPILRRDGDALPGGRLDFQPEDGAAAPIGPTGTCPWSRSAWSTTTAPTI